VAGPFLKGALGGIDRMEAEHGAAELAAEPVEVVKREALHGD
jgi:hypothetical protein